MFESVVLGTLSSALVLSLIHLSAPLLRPLVQARGRTVGALGIGMSVSYVFLHLLHELDEGGALLGPKIHLVTLIGFLLFYTAQHLILKRDPDGSSDQDRFKVRIIFKWIYSWLLVFAMPRSVLTEGWYFVPILLALALHLLHDDLELALEFREAYDRWGARALALAPLVGWVSNLLFSPQDSDLADILTAGLAGSVLYNTLSNKSLTEHRLPFLQLLAGVLLFFSLHHVAASVQ